MLTIYFILIIKAIIAMLKQTLEIPKGIHDFLILLYFLVLLLLLLFTFTQQ